ncbi:MAG TPA: M20/M25/M40 family metallo-hydrolase [Steroidobacteraceae bacterium]|nr:M20/M25/M40 family metallo-hydrolase [Steroidobacteraceae bacterium]
MKTFLAALLTLVSAPCMADVRDVQRAANEYYEQNARAILAEFGALLSLPNHADDRAGMERNLLALEQALAKRGLKSRRLEVPGAVPSLYAELPRVEGRPTVLWYAHYDGQPVGSSGWNTEPFQPMLAREGKLERLSAALPAMSGVPDDAWRIHARSASDDKGAIAAMLAALDALRAAKIPLSVNLKIFLEGEEETGSPNLPAIVRSHAELIAADLLLFADGPRHQSGRPQVVLGVRGSQGAELTLFGPSRALHSGHYGNWAPNPAARLADVLASVRAPDGRVKIEGYYDTFDRELAPRGVVPDEDLEKLLLQELGLGARENAQLALASAVTWPAINVVGLRSGDTGGSARNAIPVDAAASLDFRLVPRQTPASVREVFERHLRSLGYRVVGSREQAQTAPDRERVALVTWGRAGYSGARFTDDAPMVRSLIDLMRQVHGERLVVAPILGGSLPLSIFADNAPVSSVVVLPIANYDNNQHAPNENVTLGSLRYGIATFAAAFAALR